MPSPPARDRRHRLRAPTGGGLSSLAGLMVAVLVLLALSPPAGAQPVIRDDEDLDFDRPEAWAMQYFTSASLLTGLGVPMDLEPGAVELGLEAGWIPELDGEQRQIGFVGTKAEDVNKAPLLARLRGTVGLGGGFSATLGYTPPVEVFDGVEAHLLAASLNRPLGRRGPWRLGGRLFGQWGRIDSDITCPQDSVGVTDPDVFFRCEAPSSDEMTLRYLGGELSTARDAGGPWVPYAALTAQHMDLEFQVDARYNGLVDRSRLTTDGWTWSASVGTGYRLPGGGCLAVEVFYSPLEVDRGAGPETDGLLNVRALAAYRLR